MPRAPGSARAISADVGFGQADGRSAGGAITAVVSVLMCPDRNSTASTRAILQRAPMAGRGRQQEPGASGAGSASSAWTTTTAFVTGANRDIGRAFVAALLERGAPRGCAAARNLSTVEDLVAAAPDRVAPVELDLTRIDQIDAAADRAPDVDLLIRRPPRTS